MRVVVAEHGNESGGAASAEAAGVSHRLLGVIQGPFEGKAAHSLDGGGGSATQVTSDDVEADGQGQARLVPPRGAEVEDKLQTTLGEVNQFFVDHHPGIDLPGQDGIGDPVVRPCDEGSARAVQLRQDAAGGVRVGHGHAAAFQILGRVEALRDQHGAIAAPHAAAGRQNPVAVRDGGEGD
jgi:hypothetical protein